jgi:hypothetical protein
MIKVILSIFQAIGQAIGTEILSFLLGAIIGNLRFLRIFFQSLGRYRKDIRVSCAYLFRIKVRDEYLLIRGNNIEQYQPVGGVYKYFDSFKSKKEELEIVDETKDNFYEENDLRVVIRGKYLTKFLSWFDSRKNREISVVRELLEELGTTEANDIELIKSAHVEFLKQIKEPIKYSKHFEVDEIKILDIFKVEIPEQLLDSIIEQKNIQLVTKNDIRKECFMLDGKSHKIAETAKHIV